MNKACVHHDVPEEASLEKEKSEGKRQEDSVRIEVKEEVTVMDSTQEVVKGCKEVDRCESQEVLNVNFDKEETQTVVLRGAEPQKIEEAKEELRGILGESGQLEKCNALVEKKLTYNKAFTRALTGVKLIEYIGNVSGAVIDIIPSPGETGDWRDCCVEGGFGVQGRANAGGASLVSRGDFSQWRGETGLADWWKELHHGKDSSEASRACASSRPENYDIWEARGNQGSQGDG